MIIALRNRKRHTIIGKEIFLTERSKKFDCTSKEISGLSIGAQFPVFEFGGLIMTMEPNKHTPKHQSTDSSSFIHDDASLNEDITYLNAKKKKWSLKKKIIVIVSIILAIIILLFGAGFIYVKSLLGTIQRQELDVNDLGINSSSTTSSTEDGNTTPESQSDVTNIALFGLDTRDLSSDSGRSDATMVLSIDRTHNKIKLTSIARDTYVEVPGRGMTKLNHAYAYGGPQLAVKTLNQNFSLDIQDFVTVNFAQLANIIDYIGGVTVNVTQEELEVANQCMIELNALGMDIDPITETGDVLLTGGQAVAYARDRTNGSDLDRTDRQREVLDSMFQSVMQLDVTKLPGLISMVFSECVTSLTDDEILGIGTWALTSSPTMDQASFPTAGCNASGQIIDELWYFVYDLDNATDILHKFIYEDIQPE